MPTVHHSTFGLFDKSSSVSLSSFILTVPLSSVGIALVQVLHFLQTYLIELYFLLSRGPILMLGCINQSCSWLHQPILLLGCINQSCSWLQQPIIFLVASTNPVASTIPAAWLHQPILLLGCINQSCSLVVSTNPVAWLCQQILLLGWCSFQGWNCAAVLQFIERGSNLINVQM